jgi:hypothetical protein
MAFAIEWTGPMGPATTHRHGPLEALRFAIEMIGKGYQDVVIVDTTNNGKTIQRRRVSAILPEHREVARRSRPAWRYLVPPKSRRLWDTQGSWRR